MYEKLHKGLGAIFGIILSFFGHCFQLRETPLGYGVWDTPLLIPLRDPKGSGSSDLPIPWGWVWASPFLSPLDLEEVKPRKFSSQMDS